MAVRNCMLPFSGQQFTESQSVMLAVPELCQHLTSTLKMENITLISQIQSYSNLTTTISKLLYFYKNYDCEL